MSSIHALLRRVRQPGPLVAVSVAYIALVSAVMIWRGISVSPDYLLLILVPVALLSGRFFGFLRDWVPFVALFLGYEALSGVAPKLGIGPQVASMVHIERAIFLGRDPSEVLQRHLGGLHWLVIACTVIYFCHFLFPIAVGMVLWLVDRTQFLRFSVALLGMSFGAFVFFVLLPTAPPWYAHNLGFLPGVQDLVHGTLPSALSPYFQRLDADPTAAFPSLHAAYPTLGALALWQVSRRTALFMVPWCLAVWYSVVFLGQHYVIDVTGGAILAIATWTVLVLVVVPHVRALQDKPAAVTATGAVADGPPASGGAAEDAGEARPRDAQPHEELKPADSVPEQPGPLPHRAPRAGAQRGRLDRDGRSGLRRLPEAVQQDRTVEHADRAPPPEPGQR
jgi:membrane-associated phospholipid phosphatase